MKHKMGVSHLSNRRRRLDRWDTPIFLSIVLRFTLPHFSHCLVLMAEAMIEAQSSKVAY